MRDFRPYGSDRGPFRTPVLRRRRNAAGAYQCGRPFDARGADPGGVRCRTQAHHAEQAEPVRSCRTSRATGLPMTQATDPDYWVQHLRSTVRFSEGIAKLLAGDGLHLPRDRPGADSQQLRTAEPKATGRTRGSSPPSATHRKRRRTPSSCLRPWAGSGWPAEGSIGGPLQETNAGNVSLPTYPFERKRFWIDPLPVAADVATMRPQAELAPACRQSLKLSQTLRLFPPHVANGSCSSSRP